MCAQRDEAKSGSSKYDSELREALRHASSSEIADTFDPVEPEQSGTLPEGSAESRAPLHSGSTLDAEELRGAGVAREESPHLFGGETPTSNKARRVGSSPTTAQLSSLLLVPEEQA